MLGSLTVSQMDDFLQRHSFGRIGYQMDGRIYIIPVTYLFDGTSIIAHSREGEKIRALRNQQEVCFQVDEIIDQRNWQSVLVWGLYEEITDPQQRYYALDMLIRKIYKLDVHQAAEKPIELDVQPDQLLAEGAMNIVYRIRVLEKSGRFHRYEQKPS
ncbi:MAG: pyridoxamine 5'-phosphate oxidase family protein [Thermoflavifilum aggregans]|nr:pyridoxamine 5'-phosphate oxidase family protein [Thermoflavifilum aggregans]